MLYMGIFDTDPSATAQMTKDGEPVKKPVHIAPLKIIELTETATLSVRGEKATVVADRRGYSAAGWHRAFTYGEKRDVMDGAKSEVVCKEHKEKREKNGVSVMVAAPLNHIAEAINHAKRILNGYYTGEIVEKGSMDDATRIFRTNVYAAMKAHKLTEGKIGTLGTTRDSIAARAITAGFTEESMDAAWQGAMDAADALRKAQAVEIALPEAVADAVAEAADATDSE